MTEMIAKPQFMVIFIAICLASQSVESLVRVPRNSDSGRFASFVDVGSTVFYQGICLVAETTQIKMQCSSSDRIKILRTVYGYNPGYSSMTNTPSPDSCAFSVTDCSFDREFTIDNECTGRNSCLMTIRKSRVLNESLFYHQTCKDFNYVQVNYQCLPNLPTKDVCGASKARLSHAYLMTPNFPAPINAGASCECTLSTSYEKGQILLRRIDMKLPGGNDNVNCGETYLEINENEVGVERKCGYERETGSIFGSGAKSLKLNFVTSQSETQRLAQGFWLEVMASPPSENHMIEIVCNPGVYTQQLSNFDILNKLKEIHEKIKRLNKTYLDPKFGRVLNNRTQLFLDKNARKFLNMTNSFSRKITTQKDGEEDSPRSTTLGYKQQKSTSAALAAMRDLELEIEKFFSSNDVQLASQIDEVERKNNNNNNKAFKSKTDSRPSKTKYNDHRLIDLLAIAKSRNGAKKVSTTTKTDKTKSSPTNDEEEDEPKTTKDREQEEIEELTQNENEAIKKEDSDKDEESIPSRSRSRQESNNAESDPNKLIEQLEQLNEELDMGEKLLKHKADPTVLNDTKISDSLAVLLGQTPTPSTHNQAAEHLNVVYANAQRQDFKHSFDSQHHQQQSNVTAVFVGLGVSIAFIALVINAAMCYSCYRKGDSMQRYREALADRSSRFQSSMRQSIDSLNLESVRSLVQDVPRRLREYLIRKLTAGGNIDSTNNSSRSNKRSSGQHGNQSGNEPYDDYNATQGGAGVYGASAGGVSLSSKSEASFSNEEPCIYNSGGESEYNASMLSDSASMAEMKAASESATPPPPPPPPPCPPPPPPAEQQHRSNTHKSKKSSASRCEDVAANDEVECVNEEETSKSHKKSSKSHHHHHKNSSHSRRL